MALQSYFGMEGVAVTATTPDEVYEAFDHIHTLAVEVDESESSELSKGIIQILNKAHDEIAKLYENLGVEYPL